MERNLHGKDERGDRNQMKRIVPILILLSALLHITTLAYGQYINKDIRIFEDQAKQIVREHFDELYPGVPEDEKRNILMIVHEGRDEDKPAYSEYTIELSYKGEDGMSVWIDINRTTGAITDRSPWDFGALINDYLSSISRDELCDIAMPYYKQALQKAMEERPQEAEDFLNKYGPDALDPNKMILEMIFISPYGVGSEDEQSHWQVFFGHPLEANPQTNTLYGTRWYYVKIDAKTGEVKRTEKENEFFEVGLRLQ